MELDILVSTDADGAIFQLHPTSRGKFDGKYPRVVVGDDKEGSRALQDKDLLILVIGMLVGNQEWGQARFLRPTKKNPDKVVATLVKEGMEIRLSIVN